MKRVLSGIQPTNDLTLGNYLGSIRQFINLQNEYEMFIFIADLHSLTNGNINRNELWKNSLNLAKTYISCGLDPTKVTLFVQSNISQHLELSYLLMCQTTLGELNRMTQFKDKSSKLAKEENGTQKIPTGLLIYPCLMAADILLYTPDLVPVGFDQKQHLELTRNLSDRFNKKINDDIFKKPNVLIDKNTSKILNLQDSKEKMSKSSLNKKGVIFLNDPIDVSLKKIMSAKTDSLNKINYDFETQPEIYNLINIYSGLTNIDPIDICQKYNNSDYSQFKKDLCEILKEFLTNFQNKYNSLLDNKVIDILKNGNKKAQKIAREKMKKIYELIGVVDCE